MSTIWGRLTLICCLVFLTDSYLCKIVVRVTSKTDKKFKAIIVVPALEVQSLPMIFEERGTKKVEVNGEECGKKPWLIHTYKWEADDWKPAQNISAKYQGTGWIRFTVGDDLRPIPMDRYGVGCFEGNC